MGVRRRAEGLHAEVVSQGGRNTERVLGIIGDGHDKVSVGVLVLLASSTSSPRASWRSAAAESARG
jgi:hypothetical protein